MFSRGREKVDWEQMGQSKVKYTTTDVKNDALISGINNHKEV